jgi:transcription-repair coupling factor (superfamily II helicase)
MAEASSTIENGPAPIRVGGAPEGFDAALLLREAGRGDSPVVHIARDDKRAEAMARALAFFDPTMPVLRFPGWDCLPYDRVSPNPEVSAARMATLATLAAGLSGRFILLTTLNAATQFVPARDLLRASAFVADVGGRIDEGELRSFLVRMGFVQTPTVTEPGDYAVRGGIIDVWPPGEPTPVRLDLFGDVLDGARRFDAVTQRTTETLDRVELAPVSEVILDEAAITRFRQNYRIEFGAAGTDDPLYEAVSAGRKHAGGRALAALLPRAAGDDLRLPAGRDRHARRPDHGPAHRAVGGDHRSVRHPRHGAEPEGAARHRLQTRAAGAALPRRGGVGPDAIAGRRVVQFSPLAQSPGPGVIDAGGRVGRDFAPERQSENLNLFGALADHLRTLRAERQVIVASWSEGARERLKGLLEDQGLSDLRLIEDARNIEGGGFAGKSGTEDARFPSPLHLAVWPLEQGFTGAGSPSSPNRTSSATA